MEYTKEQHIAALKKAVDAGDTDAANEIAAFLDATYPDSGDPQETEASLTAEPQDKSILERFGDTGSTFVSDLQRVNKDWESGDINAGSMALQTVGATAKGAAGLIGDLVSEAFQEFTPESWKKTAAEIGAELLQTDAGQRLMEAIQEGGEAWDKFAAEHPEAAGNLEAIASIAEITPMGKSAGWLTRKGKMVKLSAKKQAKVEKIDELLTPKLDKDVDPRQFGEEGIEFTPNPKEQKMRKDVFDYTDLDPERGTQHNLLSIDKGIEIEAKKLRGRLTKLSDDLKNSGLRTSTRGVRLALDKKLQAAGLDKGASTKFIREELSRLLDEADGTPISLLDVRQNLDKAVRERFTNAFDEGVDDRRAALRLVRDYLNERLDIAGQAAGIDVKGSLSVQNSLFNAQELVEDKARDFAKMAQNLEAKAAKSSAVKKAFSRIRDTTYTGLAGSAALGLAGNLGGSVLLVGGGTAITILGIVLARSAIKRGITPQEKRFLGQFLQATGEVKDTLATERAAVIEALKLPLVKEEEQP